MKVKPGFGDRAFEIIVMIVILVIAACCLLPFLNILAVSLSGSSSVLAGEVSFWPKSFTLAAYEAVASNSSLIRAMYYTIGVTVLYVALTMVMTILCAYPLSQPDLKGRKIIWVFVIFTMYFSGGMIPTFLMIQKYGLIDSTWSLILPGAISTYNMILMKSYFSAIPKALSESAVIDGANDFQVLMKIVLPLSKPMIATISLFYCVSRWNAVQDCLLYMNAPNKYVLQLRLRMIVLQSTGLSELMNEAGAAMDTSQLVTSTVRSACLIFGLIPIMIIYPWLQKYFVKGVMIGSVKG